MNVEFSRRERLDTIGERERIVEIAADDIECAALARRFGVVAIDRLTARMGIRREGTDVIARGHVSGVVTQACSVTDEPLRIGIEETVALRFVADVAIADEVELSEDALDTMAIEDGAVDLGEAAAATLLLALDPFPRGPNAAATLAAAGVVSEDEFRPANAFAGLKDRLKG